MTVTTPYPPWLPGGMALSDSEKAEDLADSLETQFQPVTDTSVPEVIEMIHVSLRPYFLTPVSVPKLTKPEKSDEAISGLKFGKAPGSNSIPIRTFKHLPQPAVSLLAKIFNAVLPTHHFPQVLKHAPVIFVIKAGKDPALPSSYRPINLMEKIDKLFEKTLLARILHVVSKRGLCESSSLGLSPGTARPCNWPASLKE